MLSENIQMSLRGTEMNNKNTNINISNCSLLKYKKKSRNLGYLLTKHILDERRRSQFFGYDEHQCENSLGGETNILYSASLRGCGHLLRKSNGIVMDLTNQIFGNLTVKYALQVYKKGQVVWLCECLCGNSCAVISSSLVYGSIKSCGCLNFI